MAKIKGICYNIDGCTKARNKEVQEIEKSAFICEECQKELRIAPTPPPPVSWKKYVIIGAAVLGVAALGFGIYKMMSNTSDDAVIDITEVELVSEADSTVTSIPNNATPVTQVAVEEVIKKDETKISKTIPNTPPQVSSNKLSFAYGNYTGDVVNGKANGQGKMIYSSRQLISKYDSKARYAEPGQYVIGTWYDNKLDYGKLFNANGDIVETLTIGRAE